MFYSISFENTTLLLLEFLETELTITFLMFLHLQVGTNFGHEAVSKNDGDIFGWRERERERALFTNLSASMWLYWRGIS